MASREDQLSYRDYAPRSSLRSGAACDCSGNRARAAAATRRPPRRGTAASLSAVLARPEEGGEDCRADIWAAVAANHRSVQHLSWAARDTQNAALHLLLQLSLL